MQKMLLVICLIFISFGQSHLDVRNNININNCMQKSFIKISDIDITYNLNNCFLNTPILDKKKLFNKTSLVSRPDESSLKPKVEEEIRSMNIKIGGILISAGAGILALSTMKDSDDSQDYQDFEDIYLSRNRWRVLGFSLISLGGIFISTGL